MACYKTSDVFEVICDAHANGSCYVEIEDLSESDAPGSLSIAYYCNESGGNVIESIDAVDIEQLSSGVVPLNESDIAPITFSYAEMMSMANAILNALEYIKAESSKSIYTKDDVRAMKSDSAAFRNLYSRIDRMLLKVSTKRKKS